MTEVVTSLVFREFRLGAGHEERAISVLRKRAAAVIRNGRAEAVLVCQRADLPQCVLWIQHHIEAAAPAVDGDQQSLPPAESRSIEWSGGPVHMEFVDGAYRFPLPACRVWRIEARGEDAGHTLLNLSRLAASDERIGGVSVYRMTADPLRMIGFLALADERTPEAYVQSGGAAGWTFYPLRVSWTIGRLTPGAMPCVARYPRAAFWARLGPVAPLESVPLTSERVLQSSGSRETRE